MNEKARETGKRKFHWLNVWLDFQILFCLVKLFYAFYPKPPDAVLPGTLLPILSDPINASAYPIALIVCCVFIQLWRKWAVYGYAIIQVVDTLLWVWMLLTWPDAPLKDMIWMSAKTIAFTFVVLLVTWLLIRPLWKQFR